MIIYIVGLEVLTAVSTKMAVIFSLHCVGTVIALPRTELFLVSWEGERGFQCSSSENVLLLRVPFITRVWGIQGSLPENVCLIYSYLEMAVF
jgi:hypothetical protein